MVGKIGDKMEWTLFKCQMYLARTALIGDTFQIGKERKVKKRLVKVKIGKERLCKSKPQKENDDYP